MLILSDSIVQIRKQIKERQKERILSMPAGREIDALIAEYIMGFHIEEWRAEPEEELDFWYRSNSSMHREEEEVERVPNYSTLLFSAEKILKKFNYWFLELNKDGRGISASFTSKEESTLIKGCTSLPEAICKAALISLIENNKMIDKLLND